MQQNRQTDTGKKEHYNSVLEIKVSFLGIHKWEPAIYIRFSPALHLQCGMLLGSLLACKNAGSMQ
jgi:hypothetical protein